MRTAVLILGPLAVLGGAFYWFMLHDRPPMYVDADSLQAATQPTTRRMVPTSMPSPDPQASVIGQSAGVWVQTLNRRTHKLATAFRAERFDPRKDGAVDVFTPQARFYSNDGSVVTLDGASGRVALSQMGDRSDPNALGTSTPTEGELQDVVIRFYEQSHNGEPAGEAVIVVHVPAIRFDAIGNRISTIDSVIDGQGVMAEQVPVTVRGRDFEFDGQGLTMQWNDRVGRLDNLEINRGNRLLVKNVERFGGEGFSRATAAPTQPLIAMHPAAMFVGLLQAPATPAVVETKSNNDLYHATFDRDVKIIRDGDEIAGADIMKVVLPLGDSKQKKAEPTTRRTRARQTQPKPEEKPTTAPSPIEVRWTGKLTLRAAELVPDAPSNQTVELVGNPAWVSENGGRVDARLIHAQPHVGKVRIEPGGPVRAISVRDPSGAELRSRSPLLIDQDAGIVEVNGGGQLTTPAAPDSTSKTPTTVSWSNRLLATLSETEGEGLKEILIDGDAAVKSDQLSLACQTLTLGFDSPPSATPAKSSSGRMAIPSPDLALLRRIDANGTARMEIGDAATQRTLAADHIQLGLVAGVEPNTAAITSVKCERDVALTDATGFDLACGTLDVETRPIVLGVNNPVGTPASTTSDTQADTLDSIVRLVAVDAVRLKQADGSRASADRIELTGDAAERKVQLTGAPAIVAGERGALEGTRIELDPKTGNVNVPTPGRFAGIDPKNPESTMAIAWAESMNADGNTGICNLVGGVSIDGTNPDGTRLQASARRGVIHFGTRKSSTPATAPADPATAGITLDSLRALQLSEDVDVAMNAADVRTSSIQTQAINIDLEAGTVTAPKPGRMLLIDQRPADSTTQPTTAPTTAPAAGKMGPGALALEWNEDLVWKMREGTLTIAGAVRLGFEREGSDDPIRISCDEIVCGLAPIQTGDGAEQLAQRVELRSISARRNVAVRSKEASFDSATLTFDALTNRATATGNKETPVQVFDADGTSHVGFSAITWNLDTGMIEDFRDIDGRLRR